MKVAFSAPAVDLVPSLMWSLYVLVPLALLYAALVLFAQYGTRHAYLVDEKVLNIRLFPYEQIVPRAEILPDSFRRVDLETDEALGLSLRLNGTGLPNLKVGTYRLKDGKAAFVLVTDPAAAVFFELRDGKRYILSVESPREFAGALGLAS
ncbi:PH domain-containing protein [Pseudokordiimonas caeni]|uniref:PH domain-containing protein n=1 Tax=Pseudokordiimonas caeni TaxID=2997908 RepID=UPI00281244BB|nr:PH domain-containing protein [Pseudokordiimonas caeni]